MSVVTLEQPAVSQALPVPVERLWRISVERYHEMIQAGVLTEDDPVELLEGLLVTRFPKTPPHSAITYAMRHVLESLLPSGWYVDSHSPITTHDSEPEPDVVVVRGHIRQYVERHPNPSEAVLIVEIADASLHQDRTTKQRLYARAGIPVYWIVNLTERQIEVYTHPISAEAEYTQHHSYSLSEVVPVILDGVEIGHVPIQTLWSK